MTRWGTYTLREVLDRTGLEARQVRQWIALELVWPEEPAQGRGHRPRFSQEDLEWIMTLRDLTALGIPATAIARWRTSEDGLQGFADRLARVAVQTHRSCPWYLVDTTA